MGVSYIGIILSLIGFALLLAAGWCAWMWLRPDRSAHLRHCPSCWHDLRHIPGHHCPECGAYEPDELPFFKPRRPRRWLAAGCACAALAAFAWWLSPIERVGWAYYLPDRALIWMYPDFEQRPAISIRPKVSDRPLFVRLVIRLSAGDFSVSERRALADRLISVATNHADPNVRADALGLLGLCGEPAAPTLPALRPLIASPNPAISAAALGAAWRIDGNFVSGRTGVVNSSVLYLRDDGSADTRMQSYTIR